MNNGRVIPLMAQQEGRDVPSFLQHYLAACKTVARAAKRLGVSVTVLYRELRTHHISPPAAPRIGFTYKGRVDSIAGHIRHHGLSIDPKTVRSRMAIVGWTIEDALERPIMTPQEIRERSVTARRNTLSERTVESYLKDCVEGAGGEVRKVSWVGRRGAPDRLVLLRGKCVWVELKRPSIDRPDPHQAREHERMRRLGGCDVRVLNNYGGVDALIDEMVGVGNARSSGL